MHSVDSHGFSSVGPATATEMRGNSKPAVEVEAEVAVNSNGSPDLDSATPLYASSGGPPTEVPSSPPEQVDLVPGPISTVVRRHVPRHVPPPPRGSRDRGAQFGSGTDYDWPEAQAQEPAAATAGDAGKGQWTNVSSGNDYDVMDLNWS